LHPMDRPRNRLTIRLFKEEVAPTAAMALLLANCPNTMMSAALNSSCKMLEAIRGIEKRSRLPTRGPLHISISDECRIFVVPFFPVRDRSFLERLTVYRGGWQNANIILIWLDRQKV